MTKLDELVKRKGVQSVTLSYLDGKVGYQVIGDFEQVSGMYPSLEEAVSAWECRYKENYVNVTVSTYRNRLVECISNAISASLDKHDTEISRNWPGNNNMARDIIESLTKLQDKK